MMFVTPGPDRASMAALCVITFWLPPSVPPVSRTISGADLPDLAQLGLGQLEGVGADDLGPGPQSRPPTRFGGVLRHQADTHDSEPACGAAAGHGAPALGLSDGNGLRQQREGLFEADGDISVDRRRHLHPAEELFGLQVEGHQLGEGTAEIDEEPDVAHEDRPTREDPPAGP